MKKISLPILCVALLMALLGFGMVSCTTGDGEGESVEGELNAEFDDIEGGEDGGDFNAEDTDVADAGSDAESDASSINDEDFDDAEFADDSGGESDSSTASTDAGADDEISDEDFEDDEFLAEDAEQPKQQSYDDLAEKELEKELGKETGAAGTVAATPPPVPPVDEPAPVPPPPPVAATDLPPVDDMDVTDPAASPMPSSAGVATGTIATPDSLPTNDSFQQINPGPDLPQEDLGVSDPLVSEVDPPLPSMKAAQEVVPVAKVERNPFFRNERLMNTVYIARPGEDLAGISQKIYNEDKVALLLADNPYVAKGVETGDKLYYTSPNRPDDKKVIMTYYEDNKMAPMYYVTKKGDDIQKIGRQILGYEDAWKEVWAVNESLQSQALLPAGLKLRYWSGNELKTVAPAYTPEPAPQVTVMKEEPAEVPMDLPPAEPTASLPMEDPGLASDSAMPQDSMSPPPSGFDGHASVSPSTGDNSSSLMTIAGGAIIGLAILALVAIQIKNRKRDDSGMPPSLEFTKV